MASTTFNAYRMEDWFVNDYPDWGPAAMIERRVRRGQTDRVRYGRRPEQVMDARRFLDLYMASAEYEREAHAAHYMEAGLNGSGAMLTAFCRKLWGAR